MTNVILLAVGAGEHPRLIARLAVFIALVLFAAALILRRLFGKK